MTHSATIGDPTDRDLADEQVGAVVQAALNHLARHDRPGFAVAVRLLSGSGQAGARQGAAWHVAVDRTLTSTLATAVTEVWRRGWEPSDLLLTVGRRMDSLHVDLLRDAMAAELSGYAGPTVDRRWHRQIADLRVRVWWPEDRTFVGARADESAGVPRAVLELAAVLHGLPPVEQLSAPPGTVRGATPNDGSTTGPAAADERVLARVRALLAKAESTPYPAEAETFTAGAQAVMARHSIDRALLEATDTRRPTGPGGRRLAIDAPYEGAKAILLEAVARANRCRAVWNQACGWATIVGFATDVGAVELVFTSLLVQATGAMTAAGPRTDPRGRSRTRAFRRAFLIAYATRIGERLCDATAGQAENAAARPRGAWLLPVLADRQAAVQTTLDALFPQLAEKPVGAGSDGEGWAHGRAAADLASLGSSASLTGGHDHLPRNDG